MSIGQAYRNKRVLVTGHTGFKGAWLSEWLLGLGADVTGLALPPPTNPALFEQLKLAPRMRHVIGDVRDLQVVTRAVEAAQPHVIFHLAAQPLVRASYDAPVETFATNVMGTVHVLEAARRLEQPCAIVAVTTDKCYANREWVHSYREEDPMGGHDPYSASKGAAELTIAAYRSAFFSKPDSNIGLASARAGNVIGGGDWAVDRIVPDCVRALQVGRPIPLRNRLATRPWQHVLEPLAGYLALGSALMADGLRAAPATFASGFNFGPTLASNRSVLDLVLEMLRHWPGSWADCSSPGAVHEAKLLSLAIDKAHHFLGWRPVWDFAETVRQTAVWYRAAPEHEDVAGMTREQIAAYTDAARKSGLSWAA